MPPAGASRAPRLIDPELVRLLECPVCRASLAADENSLACAGGHTFAVQAGIPRLTPEADTFDRRQEWERKQRAAVPEYEAELRDADGRRQAGAWTVGRLFGEFWSGRQEAATALDVGCGINAEQAYFRPEWRRDRVRRLVGVDPLFHPGSRDYDFVQGIAERLPFADEAFDVVLFATSLDHIVDIGAALRESRRVLKPEGSLAVWISVFDPGLHRGVSSALRQVTREAPWRPHALTAYLRVLYAVEQSRRIDWRDRFHLHRFELRELEAFVSDSAYAIQERLFLEGDSQSVPHVFLRASPS